MPRELKSQSLEVSKNCREMALRVDEDAGVDLNDSMTL